ncbi:PAQR family membrane homeostasis protein TrhA [Lysinibacillus sphaericus]|uniref:Membrane protein n=1 Tax=Lysinibacillus sphaericus OT4b.31 TaxID=1285586 RepID=R7ZBQ1_LYSSH|nr:hemolysin III family protein [Lysinibacillus sphaericus]EON71459.1 membrane protein [Lysinibacillus sphaericus OT4b.31]
MPQSAVEQSSYTIKEEFWNALTHGVGAFLTIPATLLLVHKALVSGSTTELISYIIFGISMFCLYLASTLYHSIPTHKVLLKKLDHSSIFLLIAGTYTPVALIAVGGQLGLTIFIIEWVLAIIGIVLKQFFVYRFKKVSLLVYIGMGWLIVFVYKPLVTYISFDGFMTLLIGGIFYTAGTFFYKNKKIKYNHAIWHVFVMAGSAAMFVAVYLFI